MKAGDNRILLLGAGGLLGTELACHLSQTSSAQLLLVDKDVQTMKKRLANKGIDLNRVESIELDVTNEQEVKHFFAQQDYLNGVVNCSYPRNQTYGQHFFDVGLSSFNDNHNLHLGSAFLIMQQAAALFKRQQRPMSVVNIASIYGVTAPDFDIYQGTAMTMPVEYASIKAAILHLSKYVVSYVKDSDFRVNCVSPGGLEDGQPESFLQAYRANTLGTGMLQAADITGAIEFLLSDQARYINGQNIIVDDGFSL
ncbi:Post-translational flagellin modification protein [Saliniradius amylolyticus]|uniref:Post-translational flagellin modification protein n=1 Tax=Saliniradius amylolyticus TaxID=2183582 RepID=A0A2S2E1V9_9ALTE|nr:oxidoreductase [Saliniradius amylolyticus]AWL11624.1 Post-translational flagellin modification protein [Saliniradius amylolyticus]